MSGLNRWVGLGHLGADAELRQSPNGGDAMLGFRIAVTEKWRDKAGEEKSSTEWVDCTIWGKRGEALAPILVKGKHVYVEGKLSTRSFEKDGVKHYRTGIKVTEIELLGGGEGGGGQGAARGGGGYAPRGGSSQGGGRSQGQRAATPKQAAPADDFDGDGYGGGGGDGDIPFLSCAVDHDLAWMSPAYKHGAVV